MCTDVARKDGFVMMPRCVRMRLGGAGRKAPDSRGGAAVGENVVESVRTLGTGFGERGVAKGC